MSNEFKLVPALADDEIQVAIEEAISLGYPAADIWSTAVAAAPQPPALGGEPESKLIKLAAELASRRPIRSLQDLCDRQKSVSTAKLIEDVEMCGDFLAAIAIDIRHCVEASRAHLAPLQAEMERQRQRTVLACQVAIERSQQKKAADDEVIRIKARCDEWAEAARALARSNHGFNEDQWERIHALIGLSKPAGSEQAPPLEISSRTIKLSGCEFTEEELLRRAVRAVRGSRRNTMPRWGLVRDAFGTGSGVATALCRRFGFDPEEVLKS